MSPCFKNRENKICSYIYDYPRRKLRNQRLAKIQWLSFKTPPNTFRFALPHAIEKIGFPPSN